MRRKRLFLPFNVTHVLHEHNLLSDSSSGRELERMMGTGGERKGRRKREYRNSAKKTERER